MNWIQLMALSVSLAMSFGLELKQDLHDLPEGGQLWALLVAGSKGFMNYRHQADICHAYQVVHAHGVPEENIVVMMYDDIANNPVNDFPGKIFNRPNGSDVYHGVPKHYTGEDNNPENFLSALKGEPRPDGKRVIASGPNDHVFVFFSDHGAPGLVAFPDDVLKAPDLIQTIKAKHEKNGFAKLVFYMEACESGSMFKGLLPNDINVFATTAANPTQSSLACYYDKHLGVYLGDVYSVKWLEDSDREDLEVETLQQQYSIVKNETDESEVCEYGDLTISHLAVGLFQGQKETQPVENPDPSQCGRDQVFSGDVERVTLERRIHNAQDTNELLQAQTDYNQHMTLRHDIESKMWSIVSHVVGNDGTASDMFEATPEITDYECYYGAVDAFHEECFNLGHNDYALRVIFALANLCESGFQLSAIVDAISETCNHVPKIEIV